MRSTKKFIQSFTMLTQLGISIVTPPLVCIWLGTVIQRHFSLGTWVVIVGLIVGLLTSVSTAIAFYRRFAAPHNQDEDDPPASFDSHD